MDKKEGAQLLTGSLLGGKSKIIGCFSGILTTKIAYKVTQKRAVLPSFFIVYIF